jgi:prolyl oligopeptidase PreP (S9A serine peptidase family)
LLRLSPGGRDEVEIREFDLKRGQFVPNGFRMPKARNWAEWLNKDLLMIANGTTAVMEMGFDPAVQTACDDLVPRALRWRISTTPLPG